jgi:hypothetical protein
MNVTFHKKLKFIQEIRGVVRPNVDALFSTMKSAALMIVVARAKINEQRKWIENSPI